MEQLTDIVKKLNDKQKSIFSDMFLGIWLSNGFGALTKKDTELLIFYALDVILGKSRPENNYEWSKLLKVTPSKIKSLRLESYLKFNDIFKSIEQDVLAKCFSSIEKLNLKISDNNISLSECDIKILVEDPVIIFELDRRIKDVGGQINYERNREIVRLGLKHFLCLVNNIADCGEENIIKKLASSKIEDEAKFEVLKSTIASVSYAKKSEGQKLVAFLDLLGETFAQKPKKLIDHLVKISKSQKFK